MLESVLVCCVVYEMANAGVILKVVVVKGAGCWLDAGYKATMTLLLCHTKADKAYSK